MTTIQALLEQVWSDEALKNNLLSNPKQVLAEYGLEFSSSIQVQVHENTPSVVNCVLPERSDIREETDIEQQDPVVGKVIEKAFADGAFKTKLLQEPKSAIAEEMGIDLPDSLQVHVYENTPFLKHIVLPANPATDELSDAELEAVAGGLSKSGKAGVACGSVGGAAAPFAFTLVGAIVGAASGAASGIAAATVEHK